MGNMNLENVRNVGYMGWVSYMSYNNNEPISFLIYQVLV